MATHSNNLAWRIPWTEEPGRLQSMGSQRVRHDSAADTFTFNTVTSAPFGSSIRCFFLSLSQPSTPLSVLSKADHTLTWDMGTSSVMARGMLGGRSILNEKKW